MIRAHANEQANFPPPALGMAAVLVAALLVGLAFNSANPLGVRAGAAPAQKSPGTPAGMESPYQNETVSLGLALEGGSPAAAPALAAPAAEPVIVPARRKPDLAGNQETSRRGKHTARGRPRGSLLQR